MKIHRMRIICLALLLAASFTAACGLSLSEAEKNSTCSLNIANGGFAVVKDDWIYYYDSSEKKLYKIRTDGSERTGLYDGIASHINLVGDWLYFLSKSDLVKMKTDGSDQTVLFRSEDLLFYPYVEGGWIYAVEIIKDVETLFRIRTDGSDREDLAGDITGNFYYDQGWIYYLEDDGTLPLLYKIRTDGSAKTRVFEDPIQSFLVRNGWIVFLPFSEDSAEESPNWFSMRTNGSYIREIGDLGTISQNMDGEWIYYYIGIGSKSKICKIRFDGSGQTALAFAKPCSIYLFDDWIYYYSINMPWWYSNFSLSRMKTDGTGMEKITETDFANLPDPNFSFA